MNKWNGRSTLIPATIAGIDGFVVNMDRKIDKGMHVKECGNLKRSFIGPYKFRYEPASWMGEDVPLLSATCVGSLMANHQGG